MPIESYYSCLIYFPMQKMVIELVCSFTAYGFDRLQNVDSAAAQRR